MFAIIVYRIENGGLVISRCVGGFASVDEVHRYAEQILEGNGNYAVVEVEHVDGSYE